MIPPVTSTTMNIVFFSYFLVALKVKISKTEKQNYSEYGVVLFFVL